MTDKQVVLQDYLAPQSLQDDAIKDLAIGVSKLAASWLKLCLANMRGWSGGSFATNLDAVYGRSQLVCDGDLEVIADLAQKELERFVPCRYGYVPLVNLDFSTGTGMFYIIFSPR